MQPNKGSSLFLLSIGLVIAAALIRILPHPYNFTPIAAMALFGGRFLPYKLLAVALPFGALLLSDWVIGFHATMPFVYGAFLLILGIGFYLRRYTNYLSVFPAAFIGSLSFYTSFLKFFPSIFKIWLTISHS